jgi:hypothetical protein
MVFGSITSVEFVSNSIDWDDFFVSIFLMFENHHDSIKNYIGMI